MNLSFAFQPMTATVLTSRRIHPAQGLNEGGAGKVGRNAVQRADGTHLDLSGNDRVELSAGDVFLLESPGGGGCGAV